MKYNNRKRLTNDIFIERSNIIHNNFYTYPNLNYKNNKTIITINCPIHGDFPQLPGDHLNGSGCWDCYKESQKMDNDTYFTIVKEKHNYKYEYFNDYKGSKYEIKIKCPDHGIFYQLAQNHIKGNGCIKCGNDNRKYTHNEFIEKSNKIHNNYYEYVSEYTGIFNKMVIKCPKHGEFQIIPHNHLNNQGCNECGIDRTRKKHSEFLNESNIKHNNKYTYPEKYISSHQTIIINCPDHGDFEIKPYLHLQGQGCPECCESKGEKEIKSILNRLNVEYKTQKTFNGCKNIKLLKFDFYLPIHNVCIEYDGIQHYEINEFFGGEKEFIKTKLRDKIKDEYCQNNNIHLLRIKYNENIEEKLNEFLLCHHKK